MPSTKQLTFVLLLAQLAGAPITTQAAEPPVRTAFFGDTHIHTMYSFDAFMGNVRTNPDDAYRYAKGQPIDHPAGMKLRISGPPLDFLMVSDHAKYLGVFAAQLDPAAPFYGHPDAQQLVPQGTPLDELVRRLARIGQTEPQIHGASGFQVTPGRKSSKQHNDTITRAPSPPLSVTNTHPPRVTGTYIET